MANRPLHVLITADGAGGVWTYVRTLIDVLVPRGVAFTVAATGPAPPACLSRLQALDGVRIVHRPYRPESTPAADVDVSRAGAWLLHLAAQRPPDVVHVNGYAHAMLPFGAPVIAVAHACVCSWFAAVTQAPAPREWNSYRARVAAGLRAAAAVIVPTRAMALALEREHGCRGALVIPNGLPARNGAGRVAKAPLVLAAGRLGDEANGFAVLDRAAACVPWPIYAAGSLRRPDGSLEVPRALHVLGDLDADALAAWMDRAAIYAHPARYEPSGLAPLEAARAGCALVLGDIASLREVWEDAAIFVDPASDAALTGALARLAGDAVLRARLSAAARTRAARYTSERMAGDYEAVYHELADCTIAMRARA